MFQLKRSSLESLLNGVSGMFLMFPVSILFLTHFEDNTQTDICGLSDDSLRTVFMVIVSLLVTMNLTSLLYRIIQRVTHLATGIFFLVAGGAHVYRLMAEKDFILIGVELPECLSVFLIVLLFTLAIVNALFLLNPVENKNDRTLNRIYSDFRLSIDDLPPYTAIFAGIGYSVLWSIPYTGGFMLSLYLLDNSMIVREQLFDEGHIVQLAWVGLVGAQGSIVSMLIRLRSIGKEKNGDKQNRYELFLNSFMKPFIGLSLAHFGYFLIYLGMLIPNVDKGSEDFFFYTIVTAFAAGFTERLSKDIHV